MSPRTAFLLLRRPASVEASHETRRAKGRDKRDTLQYGVQSWRPVKDPHNCCSSCNQQWPLSFCTSCETRALFAACCWMFAVWCLLFDVCCLLFLLIRDVWLRLYDVIVSMCSHLIVTTITGLQSKFYGRCAVRNWQCVLFVIERQ